MFVPELAGRYRIKTVDGSHERAVSIEPQEISAEPRQNPAQSAIPGGRQANSGVDISAEVVWLALALVALELGLRAARLSSALRRRRDEGVTAAAAE